MTSFKLKTQLLLVSLVIITSEYEKVIEGLELTQEENPNIGYFLLTFVTNMKQLPEFKPPFNYLSVMKVDIAEFLKPILQKEAFDISIHCFSEEIVEGIECSQRKLFFKIQTPGKNIKMATIFTSEEAINSKKISKVNELFHPTEAGFEERLQDYLNSSFPKNNKKVYEIFFDKAIVKFGCIRFGQENGLIWVQFKISIYFEFENLIVNPAGKKQSSDRTDSKNIQVSFLTDKHLSDLLGKSIGNNKHILKFCYELGADITVDISKGSEKIIKWKFKHPQDEEVISESYYRPSETSFEYLVKGELVRPGRCWWEGEPAMVRRLEWDNLRKSACKNTKKAVDIMDNHFKNWNADEEKEFPPKKRKVSWKLLTTAIVILSVLIGVLFSIFSYSKKRKWIKKRKYVNK